MTIIVGDGDYRYEQLDNWAQVPPVMVDRTK